MADHNIYIKSVALERDIESGRMVVKVGTNHGRFIVALNERLVDDFYDRVQRQARRDIQTILLQEEQCGEESE